MNELRRRIRLMDTRFCDLSPLQDLAYNLNNLQESILDIKPAIEKGNRENGLVIQRTLVSDVNKIWKAYRQLESQVKQLESQVKKK